MKPENTNDNRVGSDNTDVTFKCHSRDDGTHSLTFPPTILKAGTYQIGPIASGKLVGTRPLAALVPNAEIETRFEIGSIIVTDNNAVATLYGDLEFPTNELVF